MRNIICFPRGIAVFRHCSRDNRIAIAWFQRARHSTSSTNCTDETVSLPIGNNGAISLRITRPNALKRTKGVSIENPNVILYLPSGPLFREQDHGAIKEDTSKIENLGLQGAEDINLSTTQYASPQHVLASTTSAVVVTANYRLGEINANLQDPSSNTHEQRETSNEIVDSNPQPISYKYPTPVHDTLAAFDWIHTNLHPANLSVIGTHIGGSLALMLALTEARSIQAVAALEPICDWPSLDEWCTRESTNPETGNAQTNALKPKRQKKKPAPNDLLPLLDARSRFFDTPERCFDSFASPILFLRSAGRDVPRAFPQYLTGPEYPVPILLESGRADPSWDMDSYSDGDYDADDEITGVRRRRKALSRWPPYGLDFGLDGKSFSGPGDGIGRLEVALPWVRVFARDDSSRSTVLGRQADEMVSVMQRACFWGREKGFAERRVTLSRVDGVEDVGEVAEWFREVSQGTIDDID